MNLRFFGLENFFVFLKKLGLMRNTVMNAKQVWVVRCGLDYIGKRMMVWVVLLIMVGVNTFGSIIMFIIIFLLLVLTILFIFIIYTAIFWYLIIKIIHSSTLSLIILKITIYIPFIFRILPKKLTLFQISLIILCSFLVLSMYTLLDIILII